MRKIHLPLGDYAYDILIEKDFSNLHACVSELAPSKILIISDSNVAPLYLKTVYDALGGVCDGVYSASFDAGESQKNLSTVQNLYETCVRIGLDRKSVIVALGGGVVGDVAGFISATYMRGIRFVQIPTTLLAQTDSSVGGKVGFDFAGCKNIIGAFKQPSLVYINTSTLKSLPAREFSAGMGEVIKYGYIRDAAFLDVLEQKAEAILALEDDVLTDLIEKCCRIKAEVVASDEKENGVRAILNFGHSIGHAIESAKNFTLLHGECVALGMMSALHIACKRGYIAAQKLDRLTRLLCTYHLPVHVSGVDTQTLMQFMAKDKKSENNVLKFILTRTIGEAQIYKDVTPAELNSAMEAVFEIEK